MATILEVNNLWSNLDVTKIASDLIIENKYQVLDLNRDQMLMGKNALGEDITPPYSQNTYFKKPGAAKRYAEYKRKIAPNKSLDSLRDEDTPNLFINGTFHNSLEFDESNISVTTGTVLGEDVTDTHKNVLGLNPESCGMFAKEHYPELMTRVREKVRLE